jgi:alpha-ribazole phosphatase
MTHLCLVRHGQTDWNLEGRYQGQGDVPLNDTGRSQARALVSELIKESFTAIYTSDLKRAKETADILADSLQLPVRTDPRLREIHQGEWEGQLVEDIRARYNDVWRLRAHDPASLRPPGGESVAEVAQRVYAALDEITIGFPLNPVLVVSHGLSIATVICQIRGIPVGQAYTVIPNNTTPIWVEWGQS